MQADLARVRQEATYEQSLLHARCRELEVRLQAAEAVSVAHEIPHREVRREAERLLAPLAAPAPSADLDTRPTLFAADAGSAQAVAGG